MPDNDMAEMMKTLIEQNKAMLEMMKNESEKDETPDPSNLAKRPAEIQQRSSKIKVTKFKMVPISRLPYLAAITGSRPYEGLVVGLIMVVGLTVRCCDIA